MTKALTLIATLAASLAYPAAAPGTEAVRGNSPVSAVEDSAFALLGNRSVHEPQLHVDDEGRPLLLWREKGATESNLYAAKLTSEGIFSTPVRVNDEIETVGSYPMDELRAAVAIGTGGRVAVAWGDARGQVRLAESRDGGATFAAARRLEQVDEPAYRSFPAISYDEAGILHAVWIDSRFAENFAEEPADLFYARVTPDTIKEHNLTADQEPSVCGCCRPYMDSSAPDSVRIVFRNTTADGYRDIFAIDGGLEAGFTVPYRIGPPLWKLRGCPMSGPVVAADDVLWPDGSTGKKLLRRAGFGDDSAPFVFANEEETNWTLRVPPRSVAAPADGPDLWLVPGRPNSRLMTFDETANVWRLVADGLPAWATSALATDATVWLVGAVNGEFMKLELELKP